MFLRSIAGLWDPSARAPLRRILGARPAVPAAREGPRAAGRKGGAGAELREGPGRRRVGADGLQEGVRRRRRKRRSRR